MKLDRKRSLLLLIALLVLALDQATKALVKAHLSLGESRALTSWFSLVHWQNPGGLFGMLNQLGEGWRTAVFLFLPVAGIALLAVLYLREDKTLELLLLSAILGGAAGNMVDRIRWGSVTDFLFFHWPGGPGWPAFNVADACLSTGIFVYVALSLFHSKPEDDRAPGPVHHR